MVQAGSPGCCPTAPQRRDARRVIVICVFLAQHSQHRRRSAGCQPVVVELQIRVRKIVYRKRCMDRSSRRAASARKLKRRGWRAGYLPGIARAANVLFGEAMMAMQMSEHGCDLLTQWE